MRHVHVRNASRGGAELALAEWRGTAWGRARGLLGRGQLAEGDGIVIAPCSSIHMLFMRLALDVIYIDRTGVIVKTVENLRPWRLSMGGKGAHITIELPVGTLARTNTRPGDAIVFDEVEDGVLLAA